MPESGRALSRGFASHAPAPGDIYHDLRDGATLLLRCRDKRDEGWMGEMVDAEGWTLWHVKDPQFADNYTFAGRHG
jgi:hypothetical protein